jgi:hypothetical protein
MRDRCEWVRSCEREKNKERKSGRTARNVRYGVKEWAAWMSPESDIST